MSSLLVLHEVGDEAARAIGVQVIIVAVKRSDDTIAASMRLGSGGQNPLPKTVL